MPGLAHDPSSPSVSQLDLHFLSASVKKMQLYAAETYFREAWDDTQEMWGSEIKAYLERTAGIIFKPEAVVGRLIERCLQYLMENGFYPVSSSPLLFNRHIIREVWRYQFNIATLDRLAFVDELMTASDCLLVFVQDVQQRIGISAAKRLKALKGPARPNDRKPQQLRHVLGLRPPLLSYIHATDEPADVVRELGIYYTNSQRRRILFQIGESIRTKRYTTELALQQTKDLYTRFPAHDLDFDKSVARLREAVGERMTTETNREQLMQDLEKICDRLSSRKDSNWLSFKRRLEAAKIRTDIWDLIVVGAELTQSDLPNGQQILSEL